MQEIRLRDSFGRTGAPPEKGSIVPWYVPRSLPSIVHAGQRVLSSSRIAIGDGKRARNDHTEQCAAAANLALRSHFCQLPAATTTTHTAIATAATGRGSEARAACEDDIRGSSCLGRRADLCGGDVQQGQGVCVCRALERGRDALE